MELPPDLTMTVHPSTLSIPLPPHWGVLRYLPTELCHPSFVHAYDHHGNALEWSFGPGTGACDVEVWDPQRKAFAQSWGLTLEEFTARWVKNEVWAKLRNIPILQWVKNRGATESS